MDWRCGMASALVARGAVAVLAFCAEENARAKIRVESRPEPKLPAVWADEGQIRQALLNLVPGTTGAVTLVVNVNSPLPNGTVIANTAIDAMAIFGRTPNEPR